MAGIWTQVKVTAKVAEVDTVSAVMSMYSNSLMIEDYSDLDEEMKRSVYADLIDEELMQKDRTIGAVSMFLSDDQNSPEIAAHLREQFAALGIDVKIELDGIDEEEWANTWKQYYKPISVGNHVVIVPLWEEYTPAEDEVIVKMDPGMAFGTGTHETTRLCAAMVEKYLQKGDRMLDVGTGSGILAICASKLGAQTVSAYDIDPVAVRVAKQNAVNNAVTNMTCTVSDLLKDVDVTQGLYTFACANIVADIIIRMANAIGTYLTEDAFYVTSGIIDERAAEVKEAMQAENFRIVEEIHENGWCAIVFHKNEKK